MSRKQTILALSLFAVGCLTIGTLWTVWVDVPLSIAARTPKSAKLRIEVWEPGRDMATVSMSLPKRPIDTMLAFGISPKINIDDVGARFELRQLVRDAQALPPGRRLVYRDRDATMYVWVESAPIAPAP
ncbi:MAG TPA: hypothetical protein VF363_06090 [Candidatus Eisenbacteria bacterium]